TSPITRKAFSVDGFTSTNGIFVSRSDDGGLQWGNPITVAKQTYTGQTPVPYERMPDMAIDTNPSSPNFGNIYVTWARYYQKGQFPGETGQSGGGSQLQFAVSTNGGQSFQLRPHIGDSYDSGIGAPEGLGAALLPHPLVG